MKKFKVTLVVVLGYYNNDYDSPRLRNDEYEVQADNEKLAVEAAKELDQTKFSIWESYADEIDPI